MEEVKMFLFARWIATSYADEHLDSMMKHTSDNDFGRSTAMSVLNRENGEWYKGRLEYFNTIVYTNYEKNGTVENAMKFFNVTKDNFSLKISDVVKMIPSSEEVEKYVFGYFEKDPDVKEQAFICGIEWMREELERKLLQSKNMLAFQDYC